MATKSTKMHRRAGRCGPEHLPAMAAAQGTCIPSITWSSRQSLCCCTTHVVVFTAPGHWSWKINQRSEKKKVWPTAWQCGHAELLFSISHTCQQHPDTDIYLAAFMVTLVINPSLLQPIINPHEHTHIHTLTHARTSRDNVQVKIEIQLSLFKRVTHPPTFLQFACSH